MYFHIITLIVIKKIIQNTVLIHLQKTYQMVGDVKKPQNFDNRKIFICVMEELPT